MITRGFIKDIHFIFDEMNYHPIDCFDLNEWKNALARTFTHCESIESAKHLIFMAQYCYKKMDKIEKMFQYKKDIYDEYIYNGNSLLSLVSDEESIGQYYITNGIYNNTKKIVLAGNFDDQDCLVSIDYNLGNYYLNDYGYYIKCASLSSKKMKLFDKYDKHICDIVLSQNLDVFLENNKSPYELVTYEGVIVVYDKTYYNSVRQKDVDIEKAIAIIEWDILNEKSKYGVSKLTLYESIPMDDFELICLIATSTFILFQRDITHSRISTMMFIGAANNFRRNIH